MKRRSFCLLRTISYVLITAFFFEQLSYAAPEAKPLALDNSQMPDISFALPESVAHIEGGFKATGPKTIYLIQDAHTNDSGQYSLAKTLETILASEKSLKLVFTEAGVQDNSLTFLRAFGTPESRKIAADAYIRKGILHGHEYPYLTSDVNYTLWGVEDMTLYKQAIENYRQVDSRCVC